MEILGILVGVMAFNSETNVLLCTPCTKKKGLCDVGLAHIHKVWQFEFTCGIYTSWMKQT